jgi:outer membrane protein assembly factor BamB
MNGNLRARQPLGLCLGLTIVVVCNLASAGDWPRFHGPDGSGVSLDKRPLPVAWSETENLKWKAALPGPGSSSPIVVGKRVVVTCWTGYAVDRDHEGEEKDLRRHVICFDRDTGKVLWDRAVEPVLPEDPYMGMFTQHGYASHTPVSDGKRIYVFFGKTGVLAFDLEGKKLWQTSVGVGSGPHGWGTASSPILYKDLVIVTASAESESLVALKQETGKQVWRYEDRGFAGTWGTPVLADCGQGRTDLVIGVPYKIWGFNPDTGKLRWQCDGLDSDSICSSAIARDGIIYFLETGPRGGGTMAVRAGGEGDVSKTRVVWRGTQRSRIGTPVMEDNRIYFVNSRAANCLDAASGKPLYRTSLSGGPLAPEPPLGGPRPGGPRPDGARPDGPRPGGQRPGGRGPMLGQDYSSPVLADGKIYFLSRSGDAFVYAAGAEFKLLAQNHFAAGSGDFSSTPALSDGQLFIRSSKFLYCLEQPAKAN